MIDSLFILDGCVGDILSDSWTCRSFLVQVSTKAINTEGSWSAIATCSVGPRSVLGLTSAYSGNRNYSLAGAPFFH